MTSLTSGVDMRSEEMLRRTSVSQSLSQNPVNQYKIDLDDEGLGQHDKKAFAKCCETLTFLIRDMAHITLQNFESCIHCLRTFVEACVLGEDRAGKESKKDQVRQVVQNQANVKRSASKKAIDTQQLAKRSNSPKGDDSDEDDQFITSYETISIQVQNSVFCPVCYKKSKYFYLKII